ncbi:dihydrolipoamide dehydrogenase [Propioniferax innocua]|uniref:Dihydrolipoyl dehydrogenase n=2 Tax=Propioniferax innocua TaxID=1753 RepID=A0A542ZRC0_9ACTN|nr:dihydrolipoamide dehydrogenase [Propioniferax innocua]
MAAMADDYDVVVLGAGSGGYAAALRSAQLGRRVALVEQSKVGGTCLHRGCIPTKAWLHAAEVADTVRDASAVGVTASLDSVDASAVGAYAERIIDRLYKGLTGMVSGRGIETVEGAGRLVEDRGRPAVAVGDRILHAPDIVLATGSYSRTLGLPIDNERILTSEHALQLASLPESAIVLGGGVIGVEFASAWASLGVDVQIVEAADRLVPNEEPEISKTLARAFRKRGITAHTGSPMSSVDSGEHNVELTLKDGKTLTADVLLVAVGRGPSTQGLGFAEVGVEMAEDFVVVDERLRTSAPGVWAVGDIVPGLQLAHRGFAHGIFVAEEIAHREGLIERAPAPVLDREIPKVTYCDPEIASVGLTQAQAEQEYGEASTYSYNLGGNGRSQILQTAGLVKLVSNPAGEIVGVHMVGGRMGEQVGEAQLITAWGAHADEVAQLVHAHPTQNEALGEAAMALAGKPLHAPD